MTVTGDLARLELQRGWRSLVPIALLVATVAAIVLWSAAAARRTDTAFERMLDGTNAWHVLVNPDNGVMTELMTDDQIGKVTLVGAGMKSEPGVAAKMFEMLAAEGINIQMISTSEIKISVIVDLDQVEVVRAEGGLLVGVSRRVARHLGRTDDRAEEDVTVGVGLRALLRGDDAHERSPSRQPLCHLACRDDRRRGPASCGAGHHRRVWVRDHRRGRGHLQWQ